VKRKKEKGKEKELQQIAVHSGVSFITILPLFSATPRGSPKKKGEREGKKKRRKTHLAKPYSPRPGAGRRKGGRGRSIREYQLQDEGGKLSISAAHLYPSASPFHHGIRARRRDWGRKAAFLHLHARGPIEGGRGEEILSLRACDREGGGGGPCFYVLLQPSLHREGRGGKRRKGEESG